MTAKILDGKKLSAAIKDELSAEIKELVSGEERPPGLAVILVGDDPASNVYLRSKRKTCESLGIFSPDYTFSADVHRDKLFGTIRDLNRDETIDGILVQSPLPYIFHSLH